MDDYYALLGVDTGASTDDIRAAYRDRKAELGTANTPAAKTDAARLNKAWNVLADPYQRGRYDEARAQAEARGDLGTEESDHDAGDVEASGDGRPARGARPRPAAASRAGRALPPPTITPPAGTRFPQPKQRVIAMAIDLFVLLTLFIGAQFLGVALAKSQHPTEYKDAQQLRDHTLPDAQEATDDAKKDANAAAVDRYEDAQKSLDAANEGGTQQAKDAARKELDAATKALDPASKKYVDAKNREDELTQQLEDLDAEIAPSLQLANGAFFLVGLLYLVVPSIAGGRTFGKRFQRVQVVREDGSPLRVGDAIKRYGLVILATYALSFVLGPLAAVVVLVGVTTWMRNPNMQGMHDRFARTIVVTDATT
jgi:curved DNA-binding protein CbpA